MPQSVKLRVCPGAELELHGSNATPSLDPMSASTKWARGVQSKMRKAFSGECTDCQCVGGAECAGIRLQVLTEGPGKLDACSVRSGVCPQVAEAPRICSPFYAA